MSRALAWCVAVLFAASSGCGGSNANAVDPALVHARWVVAQDWRITIFEGASPVRTLTTGHRDWKPIWSPGGDEIVFFRSTQEDAVEFQSWRTKICVVNADGTGFRELTSGDHADFNPTWTRDGTSRILFNREFDTGTLGFHVEMYVTSPDASPGDEVAIPGDDAYEYQWVDSGLKDGRLFVDGVRWGAGPSDFAIGAWLTAPDGEGGWTREPVARPLPHIWHKVSVSPSETRITFMYDNDGEIGDYTDDVLYWAELDVPGKVVRNPVAITGPTGDACLNEYPRWSEDEQFIIYDSNCATGFNQVYAYRIADGATMLLAGIGGTYLMIASFEGVPQ
jgi:hypothetical protein